MSDYDRIGKEIMFVTKVVRDKGLGAGIAVLSAIVQTPRGEKKSKIKEKQEQTLFVKTNEYNGFPKMYDEEGAEFVVAFIDGEIKGKFAEHLSKVAKDAKDASMDYALVRLEKGFLVDNQGYLISNVTNAGNQRRVQEQIISTNDGICMEVVKGRIEGGTRNGKQFTTEGTDQIKAMYENGAKAKGLTLLGKVADNLTNLFDAAQFILDLGKGTRSFSIMPGITPLTGAIAAVGMLGDMEWRKLDLAMDKERLHSLEVAKLDGLKGVRDFVDQDIKMVRGSKALFGNPLDNGEFAYYLRGVSIKTADKLLAGDIKSIKDLNDSFIEESQFMEVVLLLKKVGHPDFVETIYIVEEFYTLKK